MISDLAESPSESEGAEQLLTIIDTLKGAMGVVTCILPPMLIVVVLLRTESHGGKVKYLLDLPFTSDLPTPSPKYGHDCKTAQESDVL